MSLLTFGKIENPYAKVTGIELKLGYPIILLRVCKVKLPKFERMIYLENYINVGTFLSTKGPITDITTNVTPVVIAAIANSKVLNEINTEPAGETTIHSTESQGVVFSEIRKFLDNELGQGNYQVQANQRFQW